MGEPQAPRVEGHRAVLVEEGVGRPQRHRHRDQPQAARDEAEISVQHPHHAERGRAEEERETSNRARTARRLIKHLGRSRG